MAATTRRSGLFQGPGQLFDLAARDHPQSAPCSLVELALQGTTEIADLHVRQAVKADDDPVLRGRLLCTRGYIPPSPPKVRVGLDFQVSVGFGVVWLLTPRDRQFGPEIRVLPVLRLLEGDILPRSGPVASAKGLPPHRWLPTLLPTQTPGRDGLGFRLM